MRSISIDYSQIRQQKVRFFHIFLSLIISSRRHRLQITNEADEVLLGKRPRQQATGIKTPRKMYGKNCSLRTLSRETIVLPKSALIEEAFTLLLREN